MAEAEAATRADGASPCTLRLWQLLSPTLPVGAYAYSAGLETAIERGWVRDESSLVDWVDGQLQCGLGGLDLPVLHRLQAAWRRDDGGAVADWTAHLLASRETAELRAEDIHIGRALMRLLGELGIDEARGYDRDRDVAWATAFALATERWSIDPHHAGLGYAWAWSENQVAAAVKLVPLGQSAGQRALFRLADAIAGALETAHALDDESIGATTPGVSLASGWHEVQYSRLFRS
jgi:urease accessory protein